MHLFQKAELTVKLINKWSSFFLLIKSKLSVAELEEVLGLKLQNTQQNVENDNNKRKVN